MKNQGNFTGKYEAMETYSQYSGAFLFLDGLELYSLPFELDNLIM